MGLDCLDCFFGRVEDDIAGGIVQPLYFEVGIASEVVADLLVGHVVHAIQVPCLLSDLDVLLCEVNVCFQVEVASIN